MVLRDYLGIGGRLPSSPSHPTPPPQSLGRTQRLTLTLTLTLGGLDAPLPRSVTRRPLQVGLLGGEFRSRVSG